MKISGFLLFTMMVLCTGCGSDSPNAVKKEKTVPVTGQVLYQKKPISNASVTFIALDGKSTSRGTTDASGTFRLSTYATDDGAPVGNFKVIVAVSGAKEIEPGVLAPEPPGGFKSPIPTIYANPSTTTLTADVKEGDKNHIVLDLK